MATTNNAYSVSVAKVNQGPIASAIKPLTMSITGAEGATVKPYTDPNDATILSVITKSGTGNQPFPEKWYLTQTPAAIQTLVNA